MSKKLVLVAMVLMLALGATNVFADGDEPYGAVIDDGRINNTDLSAPVAVFYSTEEATGYDEDLDWYYTYDVITGVELWAIDSNSNGYLAMSVSLAEINQALAATSNDYVVFQQGEFSLGYSESGWYWVTGPDGYEFTWEA